MYIGTYVYSCEYIYSLSLELMRKQWKTIAPAIHPGWWILENIELMAKEIHYVKLEKIGEWG